MCEGAYGRSTENVRTMSAVVGVAPYEPNDLPNLPERRRQGLWSTVERRPRASLRPETRKTSHPESPGIRLHVPESGRSIPARGQSLKP
jgi:hypothetical protein